MPMHPKSDDSQESTAARSCRKLASHLERGTITFDDYSYNVTINIVYNIDFIDEYILYIPIKLINSYIIYLKNFLLPVDFMPSPRPFLAGKLTDEQIAKAKIDLRPRYLLLFNKITSLECPASEQKK